MVSEVEAPDEVIVYCWPFTEAAEKSPTSSVTSVKLAGKEKVAWYKYDPGPFGSRPKEKTDAVSSVATWCLVIWIIALIPSLHVNFGGSSWAIFKFLPLMVLPLYGLRKGLTHIRVHRYGISFDSTAGRSLLRRETLLWDTIKRVYLEKGKNPDDPMSSHLVVEMSKISRKRIPLKKIASANEWRKLVAGLQYFTPNGMIPNYIDLDEQLLDGCAAAGLDKPTYTRLWLEALSAPPRRERLVPLAPGAELQAGKYRIVEKLGSGGQGSAYLASKQDGSKVVLKEYILPVYVDKPVRKQAIEMFQHEASTLSALHDDHIVKMLDSFIEDQRAYLVIEYVEGRSLRQSVLQNGAISEADCLRLAEQMCLALKHLHSQKPAVVHQDFTPDNLILDKSGKLKLIDFMVAKQSSADETGTSTVVGKHHYMPPEQFRGKATPQSDLYALGCTLYFLLTGKDPEPMSPAHPILINESVTPELDQLVEKATQLDCSKRYKSIDEIQHDLELLIPRQVNVEIADYQR